jgi:NAD(P)-dependent dehydrogenase (short-subunit alcohol dehydrogenase family)
VHTITGGANGVGLATAKLISDCGGTVCIADVDPNTLNEVKLYFSPTPLVFSLWSQESMSRTSKRWKAGLPTSRRNTNRLYGAANIAGVIGKDHGIKCVADLDDDEGDKVTSVNLTGMMYCLRAELNRVSRGGSIVNMGSIHATTGEFPLE